MKKSILLLVVFAVFFSLSTSALAQKNEEKTKGRNIPLEELSEKERNLILERSEVIAVYIAEIEKAHAKLKDLNNQLSSATNYKVQNELSLKVLEAENELDKALDNTEEYGLVKIDPITEDDKVSPLSLAGDFKITENQILYDSVSGKYLHHTAGNWKNTNWKNDYTCGVCVAGWKDVGGSDGYYLASLHAEINTYNPQFQSLYYSNWSNYIDWTNTASTYSSSNGFGWEFQDEIRMQGTIIISSTDYNADRMLGWYLFDFVGGTPKGKTISFKVDAGHSWSSTSLTGIGVGPYSFSFSWTSDNYKWNKADTKTYTF